MDFQIQYSPAYSNGYMTWNKNTDLSTDICNSLNIKQGSFFQNLNFGSQLYTIQTVTQANTLLVSQYATAALNWLVQAGVATSITANCTIDTTNRYRYDLTINVTQANGITIQYQFAQNVAAGTMSFVYVGQSTPINTTFPASLLNQ